MAKGMAYGAIKILTVAIGFFAFTGCTIHHTPNPGIINPEAIPELAQQAISLLNAQPDTKEIKIGTAGAATMTGDLHAWTEAVIVLLKSEFEKRNIPINETAPRILNLSIIQAKLGVSGLQYAGVPKCSVSLKVVTGDLYSTVITGTSNAMTPPGACDKAVTRAITDLFKDDEILQYLTE